MSRAKSDRSARGPQAVREIVAEVMARRGLGRPRATQALDAAWRLAVGEAISGQTRPGAVRRGALEVIVAHSTLMQELMFQKTGIIARLAEHAPELAVRDLKFRVGCV